MGVPTVVAAEVRVGARMYLSVWPHQQQPWQSVLEVSVHAEATGWDGVWFADHFMPNTGDMSAPVLECWAVLAALASAVGRVRIGSLVSGNTYRHPAVVANQAATVDRISGGRFVLGIGSGWQLNEHRAYAIPFYDTNERLSRLGEACQVIKMLFSEERANFAGTHFTLVEAPLEPKPLQHPLPLLIGGGGERVTLRIAARYADEWNTWGTPEVIAHKADVLERHCLDIGRDPGTIRRSAQAVLVMSDDPERVRQASAAASAAGLPVLGGTVAEVADAVTDYAAVGVDEFIVPDRALGTGSRRLDILDQFHQEMTARLG